jgi:hypothetical protein
MRLEEIKEVAQQHGIKTGKMKKADIIRSIQEAEQNEQCFAVGKAPVCGQEACLWREDCA